MISSLLKETGVIAIMRGIEDERAELIIDALFDGGIRLIEITMNTYEAARTIARLRKRYNGQVEIGAGTVTDAARANEALAAGARFVVTPNINKDVIDICNKNNTPIFPGAFTPTEIFTAMSLGCEYVKLFPAGALGPSYIKDVLAPLNNAKIIAVGGIKAENAQQYLMCGAVGLGVGGSLCKAPENGDYTEITISASQLVAVYKKNRPYII